jgi:predicted double-glycine peptidase
MIKFKIFKQSNESLCGPASVRSVLNYWGIVREERTIAEKTDYSFKKGCTNEGIVKALKYYGLEAEIQKECTIKDLKYWVDQGIPVIVDFFVTSLNPGEDILPDGHCGVVIKVSTNLIWIADPWDGKVRKFKHEDFLRVWFDWKGSPSTTIDKGKHDIRVMIIAYPKTEQ